jgi:phosphatidylserine synthase
MHSVNIDDDLDQFVVAAAVVVVAKIKIIHQMKFTSKKNSFTSADGVVLGLTALVCCGVGVADDVVVVVVVVVLAEGETVGSVGGETTNGICRTG